MHRGRARRTHITVLTTVAVKCWGDDDYGQLSDGSTHDSTSPVQVSGLRRKATRVTTSMGADSWVPVRALP